MKFLVFLALLGAALHDAAAVTHSLKYFYTGSSGVPNFPEFVAVGLVDEVEMFHYDSNTKKAEPKQDWMSRATVDDPQYWERNTGNCLGSEQAFKASIDILKPRFNQTGELPSVSLLQKTPSSPVSCLATGFYPHRASLVWRKDGEELHEEVDHGEILPNHDGTFQMRVHLKLSSVTPEDWTRYDCVFQLSGVNEDIITKLEKDRIRTNQGKTGIRGVVEKDNTTTIVIAAVVVIAVVLIAAIGGGGLQEEESKWCQT